MARKNAQKTVTVKLPLTKELQDDMYVAVNNHRYQIKRGVNVEVPDYIAEVLARSEENEQLALEKRRAMQARADHR